MSRGPGDVRDSLADISLSQRLLGYNPIFDFANGMARRVEARRSRRACPSVTRIKEVGSHGELVSLAGSLVVLESSTYSCIIEKLLPSSLEAMVRQVGYDVCLTSPGSWE